jgi:hypothetical protein
LQFLPMFQHTVSDTPDRHANHFTDGGLARV